MNTQASKPAGMTTRLVLTGEKMGIPEEGKTDSCPTPPPPQKSRHTALAIPQQLSCQFRASAVGRVVVLRVGPVTPASSKCFSISCYTCDLGKATIFMGKEGTRIAILQF